MSKWEEGQGECVYYSQWLQPRRIQLRRQRWKTLRENLTQLREIRKDESGEETRCRFCERLLRVEGIHQGHKWAYHSKRGKKWHSCGHGMYELRGWRTMAE